MTGAPTDAPPDAPPGTGPDATADPSAPGPDGAGASPFHDVNRFLALPRVSGLRLSPDGTRLVVSVTVPHASRTRNVTSLWEVDPAGRRPARRLTSSPDGESFAAFCEDGTVLFTSRRPDPQGRPRPAADDRPATLWRLPHVGEAVPLAERAGGFAAVAAARKAPVVVALADTLPDSEGEADDGERRRRRGEAKVGAVLHDSYPIRYWDEDLGPGAPRLLVARLPEPHPLDEAPLAGDRGVRPETLEWRGLTGHEGHGLRHADVDLTGDGSVLVTTWQVPEAAGSWRSAVVAVDLADGRRRTLVDDPARDFREPRVSPDGRWVAVVVEDRPSPHEPPEVGLGLVPLAGRAPADGDDGTGGLRPAAPGWDRWPGAPVWLPDGSGLLVTADEDGARPVFRIGLDGAVTRLTGDRAAYTDVCVSPDGERVYALRSTLDAPPHPVWLDPVTPAQSPAVLPGPVGPVAVPGRLTEVTATGVDGAPVRGWLCLPEGPGSTRDAEPAGRAPLVLWLHGGPLSSWNEWMWRWCPWLLTAQGYAVVIPDFALSTGYGREFVRRGWGAWGGHPSTDALAVADAASGVDGVDGRRQAVMGASFGGYLTNWVLGHTDRFAAAVTHASIYALDQFGGTTDAAHYWRRELTPEMEQAHSPHRHVDAWRTPTLVIHGDDDHRVPIGEALRLWWDLAARHQGADGTMPHRFLYFPDEHHWVLSPQHAEVWYRTVLAFLDHHVRGLPWRTPEHLR
ncbi:MAG: prolyl oligopeptidase family serine peptidase [Kineosporiaceae bacterium]